MASEDYPGPPFSSTVRRLTSTFEVEIDYHKSTYLEAGLGVFSPSFSAGGYTWILDYYPQGYEPGQNQPSHASLYLGLESEVKELTVEYSFQIFNKRRKFITIGKPLTSTFSANYGWWGQEQFIVRDTIEKLYCVNGVLLISCTISFRVNASPSIETITPQPCSGGLCEHIENLWEKRKRFDVTFEVEGQSISAHRFMLAARSPVFEAELFGPMAEAKMERIKINHMRAEVFKALLYFVYTDELAKDGSSKHETLSIELLQGLFVAADRYGLHKLTILCDKELEMNLSVDTVVTTLLLADRHSRIRLKNKCLDFASRPENFMLVALTEEYLNIMPRTPALFADLSEKIMSSSHCAKRQKTDW